MDTLKYKLKRKMKPYSKNQMLENTFGIVKRVEDGLEEPKQKKTRSKRQTVQLKRVQDNLPKKKFILFLIQ